jgi:Kef-type K+ transport system membrane component KefB
MELHQFFLYLAIILIAARLFSEIAGRHGIPSVIGELLAGLLVGPSLLGWISPDATMSLLAEIGIILLLFEVGMDTDLFRLAKSGIKPIVVAVVGFVLPFVLGYAVCRWGFDLDNLVSLFIGGTLTATSIGITVRVLDDLGQRQADEAQIVIGAAVLDDILGVLALAFLYQFAEQHEVSLAATGTVALFIVMFMLLSPFVAKLAGGIIDHYDQRAATPGLLITMALALILLFSWLAHAVGAPLIMGGFAAGIALSQHFRFQMRLRLGLSTLNRWFAPSPQLAHRLEEQMRPLIHTFAPLFFVMVGVSLNLNAVDWGSPRVWQLGGALIVVAFAGKLAAGYFIRETRFRQMAIGLSMIPRGEVGLIFAQLGLNQGILDAETYAALLIVIALTTVAPPFLLKAYYGRQPAVAP